MSMVQEREQARFELQQRTYAAKTQIDRNRLGQFATPPQLAFEMVAHAVSLLSRDSKLRFLEPGFGTGPFYSALLNQAPPSRIESAAGYEIDPHYADPAKQLWAETGLHLNVADFTTAKPPQNESEKYNLIVCNPPYVRHHHLSQTRKLELQEAVGRYLNLEMNGLSGLYAYFMVLSQAWMTKDGVGAWLIPSEFMDVNYGRKVKEFLLERVTLDRIHLFDPNNVQFDDALVSSAVVFFKNSRPLPEHKAEFTFGGTLAEPDSTNAVKLAELSQSSKWSRLARGGMLRTEKQTGATLANLFTIKRGLATGCNSFFMLTPEQAQQLVLPKKFLKPILPSPRQLETEEIYADQNGEPLICERRYLLSCDLPEHEVERNYPTLWRYLEQGVKAGLNQRYICQHREPWYSQEERPPALFLCTYMGRTAQRSESPFRFVLNYSQATAANVYLLMYPKPNLATALQEAPELIKRVWQALSSLTAEMLMGEGRFYGGGLHKLEPRELANVSAEAAFKTLFEEGKLQRPEQLELCL
jgi:hypothetical protein